MSRNYEVQVEIFPCTSDQASITKLLDGWGMTIEGDAKSFNSDDFDGWAFWGSIQLAAGQTEEEHHEALRALFPERKVTSRWRWIDEMPWDETFSSEPLTTAA